MRSKTSCFNRTIFMKNVTRFWPIWALYLVILFFVMPMTLFNGTNISSLDPFQNPGAARFFQIVSCVSGGMQINTVLVFFFSIACALLVFGYLFHTAHCNMIHALPVRRGELFFTNYISGFLFLVVPQILAFLMSIIVCVINDVTHVEYLLYWLGYSAAVSFLFYTLSVFCCMLTGNGFAALVYYIAGNIIYIGIKYLICMVMDSICYGLQNTASGMSRFLSTVDGFFSPPSYLISSIGFQRTFTENGDLESAVFLGGKTVVIYLIVSVIALALAYMFYKKRHLECSGDIVTFRWMNPIFRWVVAFCFGLGIGLILATSFFRNQRTYSASLILLSAILTLLFFFLSEMILKKSFRIFNRKRWIEGVLCTVWVLAFLGMIKTDLFHVERRIPDADTVQTATLSNNGIDILADNPDEIQKIIDLQDSLLRHRSDYQELAYTSAYVWDETTEITDRIYEVSVDLTYYLRNGRSFTRRYSFPVSEEYLQDPDSAASLLAAVQEDPETYLQSVICKNYHDVTFTDMTVDFPDYHYGYSSGAELFGEDAQLLYNALEKDILEGNYSYGVRSICVRPEDTYYSTLSFTGRIETTRESVLDDVPQSKQNARSASNGEMDIYYYEYPDNYNEEVYVTFDLYPECTHTIQALIDLGVIGSPDDLMTWTEYEKASEENNIPLG